MNPTVIECTLKRDGGTKVDLDRTEYHFKPNAVGAHVAEVSDRSHIRTFLAIPEGYELYTQGAADSKDEDGLDDGPVILLGSSVHDQVIDLGGGTSISLTDAVIKAHAESGLTADAWNSLSEKGRCFFINEVLDSLEVSDPGIPSDPATAAATEDASKENGDSGETTASTDDAANPGATEDALKVKPKK